MKRVGSGGRNSSDTGRSSVKVETFETMPDFRNYAKFWSRLGRIYRDLAESQRDLGRSQRDLAGSQRDLGGSCRDKPRSQLIELKRRQSTPIGGEQLLFWCKYGRIGWGSDFFAQIRHPTSRYWALGTETRR